MRTLQLRLVQTLHDRLRLRTYQQMLMLKQTFGVGSLMVRDTSLQAWQEIQPKLPQRQQTVYNSIKKHSDCTDLEISKDTGLPINCVTPRRGELEAKGLIESSGVKMQKGRPAHTWKVKQ